MYLTHITLTTGHQSRSERADIDDATLALLAPWLAVVPHASIMAYRGDIDWMADFEACAAWAWITRAPSLESI